MRKRHLRGWAPTEFGALLLGGFIPQIKGVIFIVASFLISGRSVTVARVPYIYIWPCRLMVRRQSLKLLFPLKGLSWFESKRGCGIESLIFEPLPFRGDAISTKMAENYLFPLLKSYLIIVGEIMTGIIYKIINILKENKNEKYSAL